MVYLKLYKCVTPECSRQIPKLNGGLCNKCYILKNRNSSEAIYCDNVKERDIAYFLTDTFIDHFLFWNYKIPQYTCKYRPDFMYILSKYYIIIEVDQNKHRGYTDEHIRLQSIRDALGKPIHVVRYNPDGQATSMEPPLGGSFCYQILKNTVMECFHTEPVDIDIQYLFY
jgi:hypothetical protein